MKRTKRSGIQHS